VAAGLAIAALLVGANMSRQPNLPPAERSATTTVPVSSPLSRHTTAAPPHARKAIAAPTLPPAPAKVAAATARRAPQVTKAAHAGAAKLRRRSNSSHADSIIAEDTVVFYDRNHYSGFAESARSTEKEPLPRAISTSAIAIASR
jgi:hypothetical protein